MRHDAFGTLAHRTFVSQSGYRGGTRAARLEPRSAVQRPVAVGLAEQFVVRNDGEARTYSPAVPTVVLPASARWTFERGPGVLRIGLHCPPAAAPQAGVVGLLHETGNVFVDRLRTRPWVPQTTGSRCRPFRAIWTDELTKTPALAGEQFSEPRRLLWLLPDDVLPTPDGSDDESACRWFSVEWPEADLEEAARHLQARVQTNGTLLTDRMAVTVSSELLASDAPGQFTIPQCDDLPREQAVRVVGVTHHGRQLRDAVELGDWDAAVFHVETLTRFPGLLARLHVPSFVTNALVDLVRFPTLRPREPEANRRTAAATLDDGLVAAAEFSGPLRDLSPPRHAQPPDEALQAVLAEYPRFDLRRLLLGPPRCGDVVFWPSAGGLRAVRPVTLRLREEPLLSPRDMMDLAADLDSHLAFHLTGPFHYRCQIEEVRHA